MAIVVAILGLIATGFFFAVPEAEYLVPAGREFADGVSAEFLRALVDHQERTLKAISTPDIWPRIDTWLENRQK